MDQRKAYLLKAAELLELANDERHAALRVQFASLALAYLRLAGQANIRLTEQTNLGSWASHVHVTSESGHSSARAAFQ